MAAIAFAIAGAALAGPGETAVLGATIAFSTIGGAIGGAIGSIVDSQFLFPAIFGTPDGIAGPKLDDLQVTTASEGSGMNFCLGPGTRVAGTLIWAADLIPDEVEVDGGGKGFMGGGGSSGTRTRYLLDFAVAVCEGPVSRIKRIWANSDLIYDNGLLVGTATMPAVSVSGTTISFNATDSSVSDSAAGFSGIVEGQEVSISGSVANNKLYSVAQKVSNSKLILGRPSQFWRGNGIVATEAAGPTVNVAQAAYQIPTYDGRYEHIAIYKGTSGQRPNALMESYLGAGNVPGYRDTAYVVIKRLDLTTFGGRPPQLTFEVEAQTYAPVGQAVSRILERAGHSTSNIDVTRVPGCLRGYYVSGPIESVQQLEPLLLAYNLLVQDDGDVLTVFARGDEPTTDVPSGDLSAHAPDEGVDRPFSMSDVSSYDLPSQVIVTYSDADNDYQAGSQSYRRFNTPNNSQSQVALPLTFTAQEAQKLARQILWQSWAERQTMSVRLPPTYWHALEGEILNVSSGGVVTSMRMETLSRGVNHVLEATGPITESATASPDADEGASVPIGTTPGGGTTPGDGGGTTPTPYVPPPVSIEVLDIPALRDSDAMVSGAYWSACMADPTATWRGATVLAGSTDADLVTAFNDPVEYPFGACLTTLGLGPVGYWDLKSTLDVAMTQGALASATDQAVLAGGNWAVVGGEIIGFATVTQLTDRTWRLSRLLRGLRCTGAAIATHAAGDRFIPVSRASTQFWSYPSGLVGGSRKVRAVPTGGAVGDYASRTFSLGGATLKQFSPCLLKAVRDSSNDLQISWVRRSRVGSKLFGPGDGPLLADREEYVLEMYKGMALKATKSVVAATSYSYVEADRVTDGFLTTDSVGVVAYQVGPIVGKGFPSERASA